MKKTISILFIALIALQFTAADFEVTKLSSDEVLILGIDQPATFELQMKNLGNSDSFEFYNLVGFSMFPKGTTYFGAGQTKKIDIQIAPIASALG